MHKLFVSSPHKQTYVLVVKCELRFHILVSTILNSGNSAGLADSEIRTPSLQ